MRVVFAVLLLANLAFFSWASWIAPDGERQPASALPAVPRLLLARELAAPPLACVSIGPFGTADQAQQAAAAFTADRQAPQMRAVQRDVNEGYWVYIGGLRTEAAQRSALRKLRAGRLVDATEMPADKYGLRVSVGLFSDRDGAERRAREVRHLGFSPDIGERSHPETVYWVDAQWPGGAAAVKDDELAALSHGDARIAATACDARAAAGDGAAASQGAAAPQDPAAPQASGAVVAR
jgi:hypothetical protein